MKYALWLVCLTMLSLSALKVAHAHNLLRPHPHTFKTCAAYSKSTFSIPLHVMRNTWCT